MTDPDTPDAAAGRFLRVLASGPASTIQDRGRPGWFSSGVGTAGAADLSSFALANRLVGNDADAACVECVLGGLEVVASATTLVALTGAPAPAQVDGRPTAHNSVLTLRPGQHLTLGTARAGLRTYLAVRGGIVVEPVLGSRSTDTLAGLGPAPLSPGDELPIGPPPPRWPVLEVAPVPLLDSRDLVVRAELGPRDDWFTRPQDLFSSSWAVTADTDRVGVRLERVTSGPPLTRVDDRELPSEGMPLGAVQIPPSGQPVVFLADRPVTGGYPVVATVFSADLGLLAQARPGQHVRFVQVKP